MQRHPLAPALISQWREKWRHAFPAHAAPALPGHPSSNGRRRAKFWVLRLRRTAENTKKILNRGNELKDLLQIEHLAVFRAKNELKTNSILSAKSANKSEKQPDYSPIRRDSRKRERVLDNPYKARLELPAPDWWSALFRNPERRRVGSGQKGW